MSEYAQFLDYRRDVNVSTKPREWMCAASNNPVNIQMKRVRPDLPFKAGSNRSDDMKMLLPGPETTLTFRCLSSADVPYGKKKLCKKKRSHFCPS